MPFLTKRRPAEDYVPAPMGPALAGLGHNQPPDTSGCCILTEDGWKQLSPVKQELRKPTRVAPLRAEGRFIELQDPAHYDDQGRYILDPAEWRPGEFERFKQLLDDARTNSYRSGPSVDYFGNRRRPGRYDKWGVRVMT